MNETEPIFEGLPPVPEQIPTPAGKRRFPRIFLAFYLLFVLSAVLFTVCVCSPAFADGMNRTASAAIRAALSYLTGWIPFSLAEYLLLLAPLIVVVLVVYGMKHYADSWRDVGRYCAALLSVLALVGAIFLSAFAPGYHGSTLDEKLGLDKREVSTKELYDTARVLVSQMERELDEVSYSINGFSIMPYGLDEMNDRLLVAYERVSAEHDFLPVLKSRLKPVMISEAMSYTHITGVYSFFTGEANLNVAFPDYTLPYTAAHELAHQRGVAREDEANMIAFLVCMESDDPYIRYSALLNVYEYVASALYSANKEFYRTVYGTLTPELIREELAYSEFFEEYRENVAANISEATNNAYLQSQGAQEGTRSYNMVVDLTVAYYKKQIN